MAVDAAPVSTDAAGFQCRNRVTTGLDSGHHNPGLDCQNACHSHGFTLAGTLYTGASSTTALAGASITLVDAAGHTVDLRTSTNGNFWTSQAVSFPVTVIASGCPDVATMSAKVTSADAGCNKSSCHAVSGGAGRIHLP